MTEMEVSMVFFIGYINHSSRFLLTFQLTFFFFFLFCVPFLRERSLFGEGIIMKDDFAFIGNYIHKRNTNSLYYFLKRFMIHIKKNRKGNRKVEVALHLNIL